MATTPSTTKAKPENPNLTRNRSIGRKPKLPSSASSEDGSDQKPEKPVPNYLKPTISSRPDPVKFVKKNNNSLEDNQKLLRRRSFDRPPSSLTSPSTSSPRIQKPLNVSPSSSQDRPAVPREKPVTTLRSSSFHGTRGVPRGGTTVKPSPVGPKKSGLSSSSSSLKSRKEDSTKVGGTKKSSEKEIPLDTASLSSAQEDEEEILKVESDVHVADEIEEPKEEKENKEVQVEFVQADESGEENERGGPTTVALPVVGEDCIAVNKEDEKEEEEKEKTLINEDKTEEIIEETKEQDNSHYNKVEDEEEVKKKIDEDETPEKVDIDMKEVESVEEVTEEIREEVKEEQEEKEEDKEKEKAKEEEKEKEKVKEEEKEKVKEEKKEMVKEEESGEGKKREVVKGKKESPSAYNDVIASKMQENPRKNKVLALAGAFQTVIDYETAASK
ncbi:unnamed protein product [Microthlaspi erraticum]|uniref:Calmodulin-binding domain-containing protein n=1 Tax=Microthlaspi erraticum TaxID=1685480 RepID=A0A6D2I5C2_9BRAS|nr:unnamed protein product [Microthlaspi erraticum]